MKNLFAVVTMVAVLAMSGAAFSFTPQATHYWRGEQDGEFTYAVVSGGATIKVGQWVGAAYGDTQGFDTCTVVSTIAAEGGARIIGVAEEGGTGGQLIRIRTTGVTAAYINGADSGTAAGIVQGTTLAAGIVAGSAGAASTFMEAATTATDGISAAEASAQKIVGIALEKVATTDTGLYNTYDVYVMCR